MTYQEEKRVKAEALAAELREYGAQGVEIVEDDNELHVFFTDNGIKYAARKWDRERYIVSRSPLLYGLKDIAAPFIQWQGTLGDMYRESKGMGMAGLYRLEKDGWQPIAKRYWSTYTLQNNIKTIN